MKLWFLLLPVFMVAQAGQPIKKAKSLDREVKWFGLLSEIDYPAKLTIRSDGFEGEVTLAGQLQVGSSPLGQVTHQSEVFRLGRDETVNLMFPERKLTDPTTFSLIVKVIDKSGRVGKLLLVARTGRLAVLRLTNEESLPEGIVIEFQTGTITTIEEKTDGLPRSEGSGGWTIQLRRQESFPADLTGIATQLFETWPPTASYYMFEGRRGQEIEFRVNKSGYQISPVYSAADLLRAVVFTKGFTPLVLQRLEINPAPTTSENKGNSRFQDQTKKS